MIGRHLRGGLAAALLFASAAPAHAASVEVQVGTTKVTLQIPSGYCAPTTTADIAGAQTAAAADDTNVTLATFLPCGKSLREPDYFLVKAPKAALLRTFARPALLTELAKAMTLPEFTSPDEKHNAQIEQNFEKLVGQRPDIVGAVTPLGRDDTCAYMGGVLSFAAKDIAYKRAVSLCITTANGKVIGIYRYSAGETANVARHLATVKAVARSQQE